VNTIDVFKDSDVLNKLLLRLPQRHPALLIDKITYLEANKFIASIKNVTRNELAFTGENSHYYPSTLILESLIQTCSILATHEQLDHPYADSQNLLSSLTNAEFFNQVEAGDQLYLTADVISKKPYIWTFDTQAATDEYKVATATINLKRLVKSV